jgi:hypothetical protein
MEGANHLLIIDYANIPTWTDHGKVVRGGLWSLGPNGATRGAATPPLGPLGSIFGVSTPLDLLSGSMWVPNKDEAIWFGFSLILLSFGPCVA